MLCDILVCPNLVSYLYPIIKSISLINLAELGNVYVLCIHYLSWITNLYTLPPENAKKKKIRIRFENWWAVLARQVSDKSCANYPYQGIMTCEWVKTSFLMAVQSKCDVSLLFLDYILLKSIWNIHICSNSWPFYDLKNQVNLIMHWDYYVTSDRNILLYFFLWASNKLIRA